MYFKQRYVGVYRHVKENTYALRRRRLSVKQILLSEVPPPSSEAPYANTAAPSGSGVQAS